MIHRHFRYHELVALCFAAVLAIDCAGSGSAGGCGACMAPIPAGRYAGAKTDNAINLRLSPAGINYLNSNWQTLIQTFAPGGTLTLPVACMKTNVAIIGDVTIADQGGPSGGKLDAVCDSKDLPANVMATITGFQLVPHPPDILEGTVSIAVDTGKIYARSVSGNAGLCLGLSAAEASVRFNTGAANPVTNSLTAQIKFSIDTKWDKWLSFQVLSPIKGTQICGASGAPAAPFCLDPSDIDIQGENTCGDIYSSVANWDPLKNLLLGLISPLLQTQINKAVAAQACEQCGAGKPACPQFPGAVSTCDAASSTCIDSATSKCVPRFLGVEGRVAVGGVLGNFGVPADSMLDLSVGAGSSVSVDQGVNIGTRAGLQAVTVAPCVPPQPAPPMTSVTAPNFDAEADPAKGAYHAALGVSGQFLNLAFHQAHQSGALCLSMNSSTVGLLNSGLFKTFLPSLGKLATRDGKDAPMMIVLKPDKAPTVDIGKGTFDPVTKKPIEPLLLVKLPDVTVDFYAMIDERFTRLFSLTADISLPLSLIFNGCASVTPAIGDLKMLISNIRTANSEILAEDPKVLADLIPAVIGLAEPALAGALKPFALPALGQFKLKINEVKGISNISGTSLYNHLGLYAQMLPLNAACAVSAPKTFATLKRSEIPPAAKMRATGNGLPLPRAVLDVHALGKTGTPEYDWRVDEGTWSTFFPAFDGELVVEHPVFLIQGRHTIEVRSRVEEDGHGISEPVKVGFLVDWDAPELKLTADREHDLLVLTAKDVISADDKLEYAYAVGTGDFSAFGPARDIGLSAIEAKGGVSVRVRDEAGNVSELSWKGLSTALHPDTDLTAGALPASQQGSCSTGLGDPSLLALALLGLARLRRRAR
jgi:hypothetical protein